MIWEFAESLKHTKVKGQHNLAFRMAKFLEEVFEHGATVSMIHAQDEFGDKVVTLAYLINVLQLDSTYYPLPWSEFHICHFFYRQLENHLLGERMEIDRIKSCVVRLTELYANCIWLERQIEEKGKELCGLSY